MINEVSLLQDFKMLCQVMKKSAKLQAIMLSLVTNNVNLIEGTKKHALSLPGGTVEE